MDTRDHVLDAVPADRAPALAKALMKYGVTDGDPISEIVKIAVDSNVSSAAAAAAAQAAGEAAVKIGAAVASIQDEIFKGTQRAAGDLAAGVAKGIEAKTLEAGSALVQVIGVAASKGAVDLQKAAAALDKVGAEKTAAIVETWTRSLAKAATTHERARLFRASGWLVLGALILFCGGGFGMLETLAASGKIAPPGINTAWNPAALYGPNAWEVCPPGTDQTCVRPRGPASKNPSKIRWFLSKYL